MNALSKLEGFASRYGALFYGMPIHETTKTLKSGIIRVHTAWKVAEHEVVPLRAGETVQWAIANP